MKALKYIAALAVTALAAAGCSDLDKVKVSEEMKAPVLNSHDAIVVDEDNVESTESVKFTWSRADYGFDDGAEYILYAEYEEETYRVSSGYGTSMEIVIGDFNAAMLALGVPAGEPTEVSFYLSSQLDEDLRVLKSNTVTITVTAFSTDDYIHMPGNYQGWNETADPKLYAVSLRSDYMGCANLVTGDGSQVQFKFTHGPSWDKNWGGTLNNLVWEGPDIEPTPGFYMFRFHFDDYAANEVSLPLQLKIDRIGLIGDAMVGNDDWSYDDELVQDPQNPYLFKLNGVSLKEGGYKLRFNGEWNYALGGSTTNLTLDGGNVEHSTTGIFDLTLNMGVYPFRLTLVQQ